jgi:hypothetical protein
VWILLWSLVVSHRVLRLGDRARARAAPSPLHRFFAAYVRYATHLVAFVYLIGRRFPGFTGREGSYEIDLVIDPPVRQKRLTILFRVVLAHPGVHRGERARRRRLLIALLAGGTQSSRSACPRACEISGSRACGIRAGRMPTHSSSRAATRTAAPCSAEREPEPEELVYFPQPLPGDTF